ncbi:MAG: NADH:flavin oxidoreductase/NADH oxidase [Burkholderiaceae bacterium]
MSALFSPLALRGIELANRVVISPMCQYSAQNGCATAWHHAHLGSLALSGAGLLCLEATAVRPEGRISPQDLGLWNDQTEDALAKVVEMVRAVSPIKLAIQLGHAGRKASMPAPWRGGEVVPPAAGGWQPVAPSALPYAGAYGRPRELDADEIGAVIEAFADSARRAARIGFDTVEVHAAHGYLLHQFLSPISNQRQDEFGGSLANRMRLPLAVFDAVRTAFPQARAVGVRVSATDWVEAEPSWALADTIALAHELKARDCDWIDVSSGGLSPAQRIHPAPGYQLPLAQAVREATGLTTMAVGLITAPQQAEAVLAQGQADLVALGRSFLFDPHWAWRAAVALGADIPVPPQYQRALPVQR